MYSFTKPSKKSLFKDDTKLWIVFILISSILYMLFALFLFVKSYIYIKDIKQFSQQTVVLKEKIIHLKKQKNDILIQKTLYGNIMVKNSVIKDSVKNLLDLIPDPITLECFMFSKNKLIIYGITPTKDVYNLLMLPPLQSIFESTQSTFYQMPNGWYKFKSINTIKNDYENTYN